MQAPMQTCPVEAGTLDGFQALFEAKGCPGYCWCAPFRFKNAHTMDRDARRSAMLDRIGKDVPVGVLAYDGDEPVGWCSVAPRRTFVKLARSRVMPEVDPDAWTITCLFVRRDRRRQGVSRKLVDGALRYARSEGARVVEAYPWDTAGVSSQHWGHSSLYQEAGFRREGRTRRWVRHL